MRWVKENRAGEKIMFPGSRMRMGAVRLNEITAGCREVITNK